MKKAFYALCCGALLIACSKPQETAPVATAPAEPPQAEFADAKYAEIGKQGISALASGDVDTWVTAFADSAKYFFNGGDSIIGKKAITAYWKDRRGNVIDKMEMKFDTWTALKVNKPQNKYNLPGVWLIAWYQVTASYKNGGSMTQWIHTDMHFDANDKVDVTIMFLDRVPINAAMAKKK